MELFGIIIALIILTFFFLWNIFAVVGIVLTLKYFIERLQGRSATKGGKKKQTKQKEESVKQTVKIPKKKEKTAKSDKVIKKKRFTLDRSSILLYTGAFLVAFAIFIFVAFNWQSFTNTFKAFLSISIVTIFYLLAYFFSTMEAYKKVSKTFLFLASISVVFAGIGLWNFVLKEKNIMEFGEYWLLFSLLLIGIYGLTYQLTKSKTYFLFAYLSGYLALFSTVSFLIEGDVNQITFVLTGNLLMTIALGYFIKREELYMKIVRRISVIVNLFANLIFLSYLYSSIYQINTTSEKALSIVALSIPILFTILVYKRAKREKIGFAVEGILLPLKLIVISNLLILDSGPYHYLTISLLLFIIGIGITFTKYYKRKVVRYFTIPLVGMTTLLCLIVPFNTPTYVRRWDPLPMAISYTIISIAIQLKSTKGRKVWFRFFNIPLDFIAYILFIAAAEYRLEVGLSEPYIIGVLLLIPMAIYYAEWALYRKKENIPQLTGAITFLLGALFLTSSEPSFLFLVTALSVIFFFITTFLSKKVWFLLPMFLSAFLNTWTAVELFGWEDSLGMIFSLLLLIFFGNVWRLVTMKNGDKEFLSKAGDFLRKISIIFIAPFTFLTAFIVFSGNTTEAIITSMLVSVFFLTSEGRYKSLRYLSGIGYVFAFWSLLQISDTPPFANAQMYAFPLVLYSLVMAYTIYPRNKILSTVFKTIAYILPLTIALIQSITDPDPYRLFHGLALITVATLLMVFGVFKKDRLLTWIPFVYIIVELIILLWDIIVSTPWWLYLGLLGMTLIGLSIWIIYKVSYTAEKSKN